MKKPKLFYLHNSNRSLVNRLSDEQAGKVLKAIYNFADGGEIEETGDIAVDTVVDVFTNVIARQYEAYNEKCEKMRANAALQTHAKAGKIKIKMKMKIKRNMKIKIKRKIKRKMKIKKKMRIKRKRKEK